jgi:hypothetical protein
MTFSVIYQGWANLINYIIQLQGFLSCGPRGLPLRLAKTFENRLEGGPEIGPPILADIDRQSDRPRGDEYLIIHHSLHPCLTAFEKPTVHHESALHQLARLGALAHLDPEPGVADILGNQRMARQRGASMRIGSE